MDEGCKGCAIYNGTCIPRNYNRQHDCVCIECLVKVMCVTTCDEMDRLCDIILHIKETDSV